MKGYFITGTDTGIGKTEVARYLAKFFSRKGYRPAIIKPVATGVSKICKSASPVSFKLPLAPLVASRIEKKKVDMGLVMDRFRRLRAISDMVIVEGIGGLMVPIYKTGRKVFYVLDMILEMELPVIVVSRPNLGTINHTLLTIEVLRRNEIDIAGIIFVHTKPMENDISIKSNLSIIEELSGVKVLGVMRYNRNREKRRIQWLKGTRF